MKWLTVHDLELIHMQIIDESGGGQGTRDTGRLESVIAGMQQETFGQELYPSTVDKAAVLVRGIIGDHPFVDGNKRTGIMSALIFLNLNGYSTDSVEDKALEDFAVKVATNKLEVAEIAEWLKNQTKNL